MLKYGIPGQQREAERNLNLFAQYRDGYGIKRHLGQEHKFQYTNRGERVPYRVQAPSNYGCHHLSWFPHVTRQLYYCYGQLSHFHLGL